VIFFMLLALFSGVFVGWGFPVRAKCIAPLAQFVEVFVKIPALIKIAVHMPLQMRSELGIGEVSVKKSATNTTAILQGILALRPHAFHDSVTVPLANTRLHRFVNNLFYASLREPIPVGQQFDRATLQIRQHQSSISTKVKIHYKQYASARARSKGPSVLELPRKAPKQEWCIV
jgi:hypothetical protein